MAIMVDRLCVYFRPVEVMHSVLVLHTSKSWHNNQEHRVSLCPSREPNFAFRVRAGHLLFKKRRELFVQLFKA